MLGRYVVGSNCIFVRKKLLTQWRTHWRHKTSQETTAMMSGEGMPQILHRWKQRPGRHKNSSFIKSENLIGSLPIKKTVQVKNTE